MIPAGHFSGNNRAGVRANPLPRRLGVRDGLRDNACLQGSRNEYARLDTKQLLEAEMREALGLAPAKPAPEKSKQCPSYIWVELSVRKRNGGPAFVSSTSPARSARWRPSSRPKRSCARRAGKSGPCWMCARFPNKPEARAPRESQVEGQRASTMPAQASGASLGKVAVRTIPAEREKSPSLWA